MTDRTELRRTLGLSIRNVLRSELGHEQPFDPHSWRCADKARYPGPCGCADEVADMAVAAVAPGLLDAATDADALLDRLAHMTEARDNARAEVERLAALVEAVRTAMQDEDCLDPWVGNYVRVDDIRRALDGEAGS